MSLETMVAFGLWATTNVIAVRATWWVLSLPEADGEPSVALTTGALINLPGSLLLVEIALRALLATWLPAPRPFELWMLVPALLAALMGPFVILVGLMAWPPWRPEWALQAARLAAIVAWAASSGAAILRAVEA